MDPSEASDLGPLVFLGNLLLVGSMLAGVFALHVVIISAVEAFWLTRVSQLLLVLPLRPHFHAQFTSDAHART